jgi:hypothetical protein
MNPPSCRLICSASSRFPMKPKTAGVKIDWAAALFHGFGVARQGPWVTGVKIKSVARSGCDRIEGNFVAQSFQAPHKTTLDTLAIPLIEVIAT